jgi:hypothetical protein
MKALKPTPKSGRQPAITDLDELRDLLIEKWKLQARAQ